MKIEVAHIPQSIRRVATATVLAFAIMLAVTSVSRAAATPVATSDAGSGFSVAPMMIKADNMKAGHSYNKTITVLNTYNHSVTFTVTKEDFGGSADPKVPSPIMFGGIVSSPISGAGWLNPNAKTFTLGAGLSRDVTVTIKVPSNVSNSGHFGAIVVSSSTQAIGNSVSVRSQVATLFLMNAGKTPPAELDIRDVYVTNPGIVHTIIHNSGTGAVEPKVKIIYTDPVTGETVTEVKKTSCNTTILPGATADCTVKTSPSATTSGIRSGEVELVADGKITKAKIPTQWTGGVSGWLMPTIGFGMLALYFFRIRRRANLGDDSLTDF